MDIEYVDIVRDSDRFYSQLVNITVQIDQLIIDDKSCCKMGCLLMYNACNFRRMLDASRLSSILAEKIMFPLWKAIERMLFVHNCCTTIPRCK